MARRTNWGGSVATFVVVTVILLAGLVSAIYLLNQRSEQARNEGEIGTTLDYKSDKRPKNSSNGAKNEPDGNSTNSDDQTSNTPSELGETGYLPQTGPDISAYELIAIYALTFFVVEYVISSQKRKHSSLT